ncbi:MAG: Ig-like domain-containing protein [Acidobacteriota bacterium]
MHSRARHRPSDLPATVLFQHSAGLGCLLAVLSFLLIGTTSAAGASSCVAAATVPQPDVFVFPSLDPVMVDVLGNDSHSQGLPLSVTLDAIQTPAGGSVVRNPDSTFTYHRAAGWEGDFQFTYSVFSDSVPDSGTPAVGIPVTISLFPPLTVIVAYDRPDASDDVVIVPDGATAHPIAASVLLANDVDPDPGETAQLILDASSLGTPSRGDLVIDQVDPATGGIEQLTYHPGSEFWVEGWDEFSYQAVDPSGLHDTATVRLFADGWVGPPNTPPVAVDHTIEVLQATRMYLPWARLLEGSHDPDGDLLSVVVLSEPDPTVTQHWQVDESGVVWKPRVEPPFLGSATFSYQLSDGHDVSPPATVTLDVQPITDPPVAGYDGTFTVPKYGRLFIHFEDPGTGEPNILGNDRSRIPDSRLIPIQLAFGDPQHGRLDFCCDPKGFWYIADDGYEGIDSFFYTVADINFRGVSAQVRLDVQPTGGPDPPAVAVHPDVLHAPQLGDAAFLWSDLLANDEGSNLVFATFEPLGVNPLVLDHGEVEVVSPGVQYGPPDLPPVGYEGAFIYRNSSPGFDQLLYRAYTPDLDWDWHWLTLTANAPGLYAAYNDVIYTVEGRRTNVWFNHLMANDVLTGPGIDPLIDPVLLSNPRVGQFVHLTGVGGVAYRPPPGFVGVDSFTYRVVDRNQQVADVVARVVIVVEPGAPTASPDTASTDQEEAIAIDVLANDSDPQGDELQVVTIGSPEHGEALLEGTGAAARVVYVPEAGFFGTDTWTYVIRDADGNESEGRITVTVVENQAPVASAQVFCDGLRCRFDGGQSTDDLGIETYSWTLVGPDSTEFEGVEILTDLPSAGQYQLQLTVTDGGGRTARVDSLFSADPARVGAPPIAHFTYSCAAAPTCIFDASSSADDVEVVGYQWDFGDASRPIQQIQQHTFLTASGEHRVLLNVIDASGQNDTFIAIVTPILEQ